MAPTVPLGERGFLGSFQKKKRGLIGFQQLERAALSQELKQLCSFLKRKKPRKLDRWLDEEKSVWSILSHKDKLHSGSFKPPFPLLVINPWDRIPHPIIRQHSRPMHSTQDPLLYSRLAVVRLWHQRKHFWHIAERWYMIDILQSSSFELYQASHTVWVEKRFPTYGTFITRRFPTVCQSLWETTYIVYDAVLHTVTLQFYSVFGLYQSGIYAYVRTCYRLVQAEKMF